MELDNIFSALDSTLPSQRKVVVVDDNVAMTDYIAEFCLDERIECYAFNNALEALKELPFINPTILVVDWVMHPMDGISFIKAVRRTYSKEIPVLFMTGAAKADTQVKALQTATSFIEKSNLNTDVLEMQIKALLKVVPHHTSSTREKTLYIKNLNLTDKELQLLTLLHRAIIKHIKTEHSIVDIVSYIGQSKTKVSKFISQLFNMSTQEYVISYRIYYAAKLLLCGESILRVAEYLGYSSQGNFSNAFKDKYGLPPLKFIKNKKTTIEQLHQEYSTET
jgi:DNA-binding response OmpR family regulator